MGIHTKIEGAKKHIIDSYPEGNIFINKDENGFIELVIIDNESMIWMWPYSIYELLENHFNEKLLKQSLENSNKEPLIPINESGNNISESFVLELVRILINKKE